MSLNTFDTVIKKMSKKNQESALTPKQFAERLKEVSENVDNLVLIAYSVGKGGSYTLDGREYKNRDMNLYRTAVKTDLRNLGKNYANASSAKKTRNTGSNQGFKYMLYVSKPLCDFFTADKTVLGHVDPDDESSAFVSDELVELKNKHLTSHSVLTVVSYIYFFQQNIQNPKNRQYVHADKWMMKYFSAVFDKIQKEQKEQKAEAKNTKDKEKEIFDPTHFRMSSFQTVIKYNRIPASELTAEQIEYMNREEVKDELERERKLFSNTLVIRKASRSAVAE